MVMLSAVCTWHAIVTRITYDRPYADRVEGIVLTILGILYIVYNIGFVVVIYLFVSIFYYLCDIGFVEAEVLTVLGFLYIYIL